MKNKETELDEFGKYKLEIDESVGVVLEKIKQEKKSRKYVEFFDYPSEELKKEALDNIKQTVGTQEIAEVGLSVPPAHVSGDFALEIFDLAKGLGEKPDILAKKITDGFNERETALIKSAAVAGPFVNIEAQKITLYQKILTRITELGDHYGESDINAGKLVVIDYSAPNIAKPIGVGHLRSTVIGQALANIYHETGYIVVKDNHLGDWGTQFGSLIYAYQAWGEEEKIMKDPIRELKNLYVRFHEFTKEHPEAKDSARELFVRLEHKDPELIALWKRFRDLSLHDYARVYELLGIEFDTNIGESYFTEQADKIVDEFLAKGFCRKDEESAAVIVDQNEETPSFLLRKQDGSSLYLTRDLATLQFRIKTFKPDTILYVVGSEQDLNFKQLFEIGRRADYLPDGVEAKHIGFGMVLSGGKKMSTRRGTLIELEDLLSQSIKKSEEVLLEKNQNIASQDLKKISEIIGIGAIIYNDLHQSMGKNISFDWDKMLDMEAGSAVYLQYSCVRINSILKKFIEAFGEVDFGKLKKEDIVFSVKSEFDLARKLMMFPNIIVKAQKTDAPHHLCVYLEELALLFNSFYNEVSILNTEDQKLRNSRMILSNCVASVLKKGLSLLSIKVPEKM